MARREDVGRRVVAAACLAFAVTAAGVAQQPDAATTPLPLTLENIYKRGRGGASNPAISPDGRWVAFNASVASPAGLYRLALADGAHQPQFWSEGGGAVEWAPDSRSIVVVRGERLWRIGFEGEPTPVTPMVKGLRAPVFSPDGQTIAFYSTTGGHQDIWLVPASGGEPKQLTRGSMSEDDGRFGPSWSPDGRTIAFVSNKTDYWADDVWAVDVASGQARQVSRNITVIGPTLVWSPNGDRIAAFGTSKKDYWYLDIADIFLIDAKTGAESKVKMPLHVTAYQHRSYWSADGRQFYFVYHERGEHHIWSVPASGGVATRVSNIGGVFSGFDADRNADAFVFARSSEAEGSDIYYLPAIGGPERRLTHFATQWASLVEPREVAFRSFDGLAIQGFLYLPPASSSEQRCPALVQVHGGGTNSVHARAEPDRTVPGLEGVRRARDQLSGRIRFRTRVPGSGGRRLAERTGSGPRCGGRLPSHAPLRER